MKLLRFILPAIGGLAIASAVPFAASAAVGHVATATSATSHVGVGAGNIALQAQGCSGDACIWLSSPYNYLGTMVVDVHGCAWKTSVYGHIAISTPNGGYSSGANKWWYSTSHYCTGGDEYYSIRTRATVGSYCSTTYNGSQYDGTACESVT